MSLAPVTAIEFPPVSHVIEWPDLFLSGAFAVNKVVLLMWISAALVFAFFFAASRRQSLVPSGVQNMGESVVDFVREGVVLQTMGPEGLAWTPFLLMLFSFIFVCNIWEVIPGVQMPVNARIALPVLMTLLIWVIFNFIGIKRQGFFGYFKSMMFPPGVPWPIYILVAPIELISTLLVRPLSLSVRLFANMLAGHLILVTFAVITASLVDASPLIVIWPFSFLLLVGLTGFEVLVAVLQAFIFTILAGVYIGGAMHPEH
ncbi:MAG: F0F1 ATP synthase subunit A [Actinomycetota bacterium]|nr:F0F1 ATP synthase subunit A [Actinomycetota bacterium]